MATVRLGIIDLGTNSVRFDVYEVRGRSAKLIHREKLMVRLGEGLFVGGELTEVAITRTVEAFAAFRYTADQLHVTRISAVATSAVRQASNRDKLIDRISLRSGITLRVISGEEEARFIAHGILTREKRLPPRFYLVDIGGGSVEISLCRGKSLTWAASFQLGTARLEQLYCLSNKKLTDAKREFVAENLRQHIRRALRSERDSPHWTKEKELIGSSGTAKALARLEDAHTGKRGKLSRAFLRQLIRSMLYMNRDELVCLPGMDPTRVDMILVGAILLDEILTRCGATSMRLSDFALREGILDEELSLLRDKSDSSLAHHLDDLADRLRRSPVGPTYLMNVRSLFVKLFDLLCPLHRLEAEWRSIFIASALLQNAGKAISPLKYEIHASYVVQHLDFPWFDTRAREIIAHLCLWQREGKIGKKELKFLKNPSERARFLKCLAILRIANALAWQSRIAPTITRATLSRKMVLLTVRAQGSVELLRLRVTEQSKFFERVFKRQVLLK